MRVQEKSEAEEKNGSCARGVVLEGPIQRRLRSARRAER
jgi:hypothetical protein